MTYSIMTDVRQNLMKVHMPYVHPRIAVKNAEKITELSDLERDIILKHMGGNDRSTKIQRKLYCDIC